ncbi:hypothetical protein [Serratia ureilytica]|uniref:hypothetical protein n=1 Tax=Serratia ureilytica TaxID=300181 RepID=UPI0019D2BB5E|nr:hypothetical protein [Serratia ureilytica]MBN5214274.1 hypothetical protein [Serratia ureilytica]
MAANQNMSNMEALEFKRFIQKYLQDLNVDVVEDGFKTAVQNKVQAMIVGFDEEYTRPRLNSKNLTATLNISISLFSESKESQVSQIIRNLMSINGTTPGLPNYRIASLAPTNSSITYVTDSSIGHVNGSVTLQIVYLMIP